MHHWGLTPFLRDGKRVWRVPLVTSRWEERQLLVRTAVCRAALALLGGEHLDDLWRRFAARFDESIEDRRWDAGQRSEAAIHDRLRVGPALEQHRHELLP